MLLISTKAQAWYTDFTMAMLIFTVALIIYFVYTTNLSKEEASLLNDLTSEAKFVSSSLVSEGYPSNWSSNTVKRIGLTDSNQKIDVGKVLNLANLTYNHSKKLLGTVYDYTLFFEGSNGTVLNISGFCCKGHEKTCINPDSACIINTNNADIDNLVKIDRLLTYDNATKTSIIRMVLYLWS